MGNAFQNHSTVDKNIRVRRFGGTSAAIAADPYVSGYHFIWFRDIPKEVVDQFSDIKKVLAGSCLSVTPPGGTLNKTEFTGLGGVKYSVPTNIDYGTSITVKFLEYSGLIILRFLHSWVKLIRDYRTGASNLEGKYSKPAYAGSMYYWTTKPDATFKDAENIEYAAFYTGMFPMKDPQDMFGSDLSSVDKLEIDVEFNVDWAYHEPWVKNDITNFASNFTTFGTEDSNPEK